MRLKIETNETTKEKIGSALKGSFDARKDHMTREALRAGTSVGDEDRDFATGMNVARTYGMPLVSVSAAALAGFAAHMEAESYDRVLHGKTRIDSSNGESSGTESLSSSVNPEQPSAGDATTSADSYKNPAAHSGGSYMEPLHTPGVPPISSGQNMPGSSIAPAMRDVYHQSAARSSDGESSGTESLSSSVNPKQPSAGDVTTSAHSYKNPAAHSGGSYMEPLHTPGVPPISSGQNMPGSSIAPAMRDVYHQSAVRHSNNTFSDSGAKGNGIATHNQDMPAAPGIGAYNQQSGSSRFPAGIPVSRAVQVTGLNLNHIGNGASLSVYKDITMQSVTRSMKTTPVQLLPVVAKTSENLPVPVSQGHLGIVPLSSVMKETGLSLGAGTTENGIPVSSIRDFFSHQRGMNHVGDGISLAHPKIAETSATVWRNAARFRYNYVDARKEIDAVANGARYVSEFTRVKPFGVSHIDINRDPLAVGPQIAKIHFNGNEKGMLDGFHVTELSEMPLSMKVGVEDRFFVPTSMIRKTSVKGAPSTTDFFKSRGWDSGITAINADTGEIIGRVYTRKTGEIFNNAGQVSSNNQIFKQYMKAKGITKHTPLKKLTKEERLVQELARKSSKTGRFIRIKKLALRQFRMSLFNIPMKDIRNTEFGKGLDVAQRTMMVTRTATAPVGRLIKRQTLKKLDAAVFRRTKLLLEAKKVGFADIKTLKALAPDKYREVLKNINRAVLKQNANGMFANWIYEKTMGNLNAGIQKITQAIEKKTSGTVNTAASKFGNVSQNVYESGGIGAYKKKLVAKTKDKAKKQLKKTAKKVFKKTFRWKPAQKFYRLLYNQTKALKKGLNAVKIAMAAIKQALRTILLLFLQVIIIFLIVLFLIDTVLCFLQVTANAISGFTGFTTIADGDDLETAYNEQLDVTDLTDELHDLHKDYAKVIKKAIRDNDAVPTPVYDNGSKENYKECISALTIMANYDYGAAGKKVTESDLKQVYDKTHLYSVVPTEFTGTRSTGKKDKDGNPIMESYTYIKNVIHVKIMRDQAVVNQTMYEQVENGGSSTIPEPDKISNNNWIECVKSTKQLLASKVGYYGYGQYRTFSYNGKSYTIRIDCSGYVSACLYFYGLQSGLNAYSSAGLEGNIPGFVKYTWNGSTKNLQVGDILVYDGHTEIWAGKGQVYNYGSNDSAKVPSPTNWGSDHTPKCIQRIKKSESTRTQDKAVSKDSSKDTKLDIKSNPKDNKTGVVTSTANPTLTGVKYYDASVPVNPNYKGNKTYMSYTAIKSKSSRQYQLQHTPGMTTDHDGYRRFGDRYVIAVGSGVIGQNVSNDKHYMLIGQYVDLILENGVTIKCVVGDAKSNDHTDLATHFFTCRWPGHANYVPSWCCSEFVTDGTPAQVPNRHAKGWSAKVATIRVYDKNALGSSGYTGTSADGDVGIENEIEYNKAGNEVGGVTALSNTLKKYQEKYDDGEFKLKYKKRSKHIIKNGSKVTSLDYLRFIYAKHGVSLPVISESISGTLKEAKKRGIGDIMLYKRDATSGDGDSNVVVFAYIGDGKVTGFVGKDFEDKNGTEYPDNCIITIDVKNLAKKNKSCWYDVSGILVDQAYGASPSTGFGGWQEDTVDMYNAVYGNSEMWVENAESSNDVYQTCYKGYYEDDFVSDVKAKVSRADKNAFKDSIKDAAMYAYNEYGILPSLYAALACDSSNYGSTVLSGKYHNPLQLKWHKGCQWNVVSNPADTSSDVHGNKSNYISCSSYKDNVDAWVEQMDASVKGTLFRGQLAMIADKDESLLNDGISGLYELEVRYYLNDSSDADIERIIKVIETNKFEKWDREAKGN